MHSILNSPAILFIAFRVALLAFASGMILFSINLKESSAERPVNALSSGLIIGMAL